MKIRRSIRRRLALSAICLVLAVVAVIAGVAYREVRQSAIASATSRLVGVARQMSDLFGASAHQSLGLIANVANDPSVEEYLGTSGKSSDPTKAISRLAATTASVAAV